VARYVYEHVFLAAVALEESPGDLFRLVRSKTAAPAPVEIIDTPLPYDDPLSHGGVDRFYYRLRKITTPSVQKNHFVWRLGLDDIEALEALFLEPAWPAGGDLDPPWGTGNPFRVFAAIPAESRARFLIENSEVIVSGITYGPVCLGQTATYAVKDHFWVFFIDPAHDVSVQDPKLGLETWNTFMDRSAFGDDAYEDAYAKALARLTPDGYGIDAVWDGGGTNRNAWLTVLRHESNTSVMKGRQGGLPRSLWLMGYSGFERIYYDTVASFEYWAGDVSKLETLGFFNFLREEFEDSFLLLLREGERAAIRDRWTQGLGAAGLALIPFAGQDLLLRSLRLHLLIPARIAIPYAVRSPAREGQLERTFEMSERARVFIAAGIVGSLSGLVGAAFHFLLDKAGDARAALPGELARAPLGTWLLVAAGASVLVTLSLWLVRRFAPEAGGSGVQEVEGTLSGLRGPVRWRAVLPVKFLGGLAAIGSGMVLGREGPTIHSGSALGAMIGGYLRLRLEDVKSIVAAGAGAGLAAAFNAPLAGIIFVTEEMREEFDYNFVSFQSVVLACCMSVIVNDWWLGQGPFLPVVELAPVPLFAAPLFLLLGGLLGAFGVLFNALMVGSVRFFARVRRHHLVFEGVALGVAIAALVWLWPDSVGGGEGLVERVLAREPALVLLLALFAARTVVTAVSYGSGVPGGIFAPMLALGTLAGLAFDQIAGVFLPDAYHPPGVLAVAGMGALFAATVRAPLTGIVLVLELTGVHQGGLTVVVTCLSATFTAQALGGRPIYRVLLENVLHQDEANPPPAPSA
jgi:H+/Cl- antiporter ClcA